MGRTTGQLGILLGLVASSVLLAGCGGSDAGSSPPAGALAAPGDAPPAPDAGAGERADTPAGGGAPARVQLALRAIIHTADVAVEVTDIADAVRRIESLVAGADGLIADERTESGEIVGTDGRAKRALVAATVVVRVPPEAYQGVLNAVGDLGTLIHQSRSAKDVTDEVVDVASRVKSAEASVERVRGLMNRAEALGDVVLLEGELSRRTAELESLLTRQAALAAQTDLATITIRFSLEPVDEPAVADDQELGFVTGLRNGWDALVAAVLVVLTIAGALLPFAATAALIGVPLLLMLRRRAASTRSLLTAGADETTHTG